jgi:two-component system sensor histidine kinase DesK
MVSSASGNPWYRHVLDSHAARLGIAGAVAAALVLPLLITFIASGPPADRLWAVVLAAALFTGVCPFTVRTDGRGEGRWLLIVIITVLATAVTAADPPRNWSVLFLYPAVAAGTLLDPRRAVGGVLGVALVAGLTTWSVTVDADTAVEIGLQSVLAGAGASIVVRLLLVNRELTAARAQVARLAVVAERERIARDLHDLLGHRLSLITLKAELTRRLLPDHPERAKAEAGDIEAASREALGDVRAAVSAYRRPRLAHELDAARYALETAGVHVDVEVDAGAGHLDDSTDELFGWTVREGVTNIIRHARAGVVSIVIRRGDADDVLEIVNDGASSDAPSPGAGNGLRGLSERAAELDGALRADPLPDGRFRLRVRCPRSAEGGAP